MVKNMRRNKKMEIKMAFFHIFIGKYIGVWKNGFKEWTSKLMINNNVKGFGI